jgi:hypothetical protein
MCEKSDLEKQAKEPFCEKASPKTDLDSTVVTAYYLHRQYVDNKISGAERFIPNEVAEKLQQRIADAQKWVEKNKGKAVFMYAKMEHGTPLDYVNVNDMKELEKVLAGDEKQPSADSYNQSGEQ